MRTHIHIYYWEVDRAGKEPFPRGIAMIGCLLFAVLTAGTFSVWYFTGIKTSSPVLCPVQLVGQRKAEATRQPSPARPDVVEAVRRRRAPRLVGIGRLVRRDGAHGAAERGCT